MSLDLFNDSAALAGITTAPPKAMPLPTRRHSSSAS